MSRKRQLSPDGALRSLASDPRLCYKSLDKVIKQIREDDAIVEDYSYNKLRRSVQKGFHPVRTQLSMETVHNEELTLQLCEPNLLLIDLLSASPQLAEWYGEAANVFGCGPEHPWRLVIAFDEFSPGSALKPGNHKKVMLLSYNFVELGRVLLARGDTWLTPLVIRSKTLQLVNGGFSRLLRDYLKLHLFGSHGGMTVGIPLTVNGAPLALYVKVEFLLADGDGLRLALDWRGASSLKPCFRHGNVWKANSDMAHRMDGHVEHTCAFPRLFKTTAADTLELMVDELVLARAQHSAGLITKGSLENLQLVSGMNGSPLSLLADLQLRPHVKPIQMLTVDWMHSVLQDGLLNVEVHVFLNAARIPASRLQAYLKADWCFPRDMQRRGLGAHRIFSDARARSRDEAGKFKAMASEMLLVYGLVRHFVETRVPEIAGLHVMRASFLAACAVVDILLRAKWGRLPFAQAASSTVIILI